MAFKLADVLPKVVAPTSASRPITNPIGLAVWCVRAGKVERSERGLIFALSAAHRAQRVGRSPWSLFWWLLRNPAKLWSGDDEWPGVKALLERVGRPLGQLLALALRPGGSGGRVDRPEPVAQARDFGRQVAEQRVERVAERARAVPVEPAEGVDDGGRQLHALVKAIGKSRRLRDHLASALRLFGFDVRPRAAEDHRLAPALA